MKSRVRYLLDVGLKFRNGGFDEACLEVCDLAKGLDGYDTLRLGAQRIHQPLECIQMVGSYPELDRCREVVKVGIKLLLQGLTALLVRNEVYEGRCNDALLALDGTDDLVRELDTSVRHR